MPTSDPAHADDELVAWRRRLHRTPELGFQEHQTAAFVAERLRGFGLNVEDGLARGTGVVARLKGARGVGPVIALRADLDALPIHEQNGFEHVSQNPGRMHACGHDGHTAMLLGAARALAADPDFRGEVVFIFQPAEEGGAGGRVMVEEGLFDRLDVERVFGLHNWPDLPAGTMAVHAGPVMAAADFWSLTIEGRGGHAAMPHLSADPVVTAAHVVTALQSIVSRQVAPVDSAVVTVAGVKAGEARNVIPPSAELFGTARTLTPETRDLVERRIGEIAGGIAAAFGQTCAYAYQRNYPPTVNTDPEAELAARAAARAVGPDMVFRDLPPSMASEDFAFMLEARPGAYVWLGQGRGEVNAGLHHPRYDFNDAVLPIGVRYWRELVRELLG